MSLQLGWYKAKAQDDNFVQLRFVAEDVANPSVMYQYKKQICWDTVTHFRIYYEFIGVEKPETWVPADPSKITLQMLPMRARFRDCVEETWYEGSLMGFSKARCFVSNANPYFQIWNYCEVVQ